MFISALKVSAAEVKQRGLMDRNSIRKFIWLFFPIEQSRQFMFKIKGMNQMDGLTVLVVSKEKPLDLPSLVKCRELPASYFQFQHYRFHIEVSPQAIINKSKNRKSIYDPEKIREWFVRKSLESGFTVEPTKISITDIAQVNVVRDESTRWTFSRAIISGCLTVTDSNVFMKMASDGFGKEKAYGCGLFELAPIT